MRYPEWVWQYYLATGDRTTLVQLYPVLRRVSNYVHSLIARAPARHLRPRLPTGADLVDWRRDDANGLATSTSLRADAAS